MMQTINDFPWGLVLLVIAVVALAYVWRKGLLGKDNEDAIKARIRKLKGAAAMELAKLAAIKEPADVPVKDKPARIAEAKALLDAGTITQAQYDAAVAQIVANG